MKSAIELADITTEDPHAGLPDADELGSIDGDLGMYSADVDEPGYAAQDRDAPSAPRTRRSRPIRASPTPKALRSTPTLGRHIFANSRGFRGRVPLQLLLAEHGRRWRATANRWSATTGTPWRAVLPAWKPPEQVGRMAAQRALRRLNAVKVETQKVPVVFEPRTARTLLDNIFEAVHGMSIYRHESFLAGKLGEKVASENVTVIDDGTIPGLFGTSPFDDEGVPSRRTVVIERGVLKSYLMNTYAARKLGMKTTGNASRGLDRQRRHRARELFPGEGRPNAGADHRRNSERILRDGTDGLRREHGDRRLFARRGRAVDPQRRAGVRGLRGDHRGQSEGDAAWASRRSASDLEFRGSVAAPTLKIGEMTVGGK